MTRQRDNSHSRWKKYKSTRRPVLLVRSPSKTVFLFFFFLQNLPPLADVEAKENALPWKSGNARCNYQRDVFRWSTREGKQKIPLIERSFESSIVA